MIFAPLRSRFEQSRMALSRGAQRADVFCTRLNPGLAAFAIVLLLVVSVLWTKRHPEISEVNYRAAAAAVGLAE
jgi:hypothetical protein